MISFPPQNYSKQNMQYCTLLCNIAMNVIDSMKAKLDVVTG